LPITVAESLFECPPPPTGELLAVELDAQTAESAAKLGYGHMRGDEVDIEQRARLPIGRLDQPILAGEPGIERSSWEGRQHRDLNLVKLRFAHEIANA